jgi:hypothetical protein
MSTVRLQVAPRVGVDNPGGSRLAAAAFISLWRALTGMQRRVQPHAMSAAEEAQAVRDMAMEVQRTDPRFAADLFAAADRHELLHGIG